MRDIVVAIIRKYSLWQYIFLTYTNNNIFGAENFKYI